MPANSMSAVCQALMVPKVMPSVCATTMSWMIAIGMSQNDSRVRPLTTSTAGPIFFLIRP